MGNDGPSNTELFPPGPSVAEVLERYTLPDLSSDALKEVPPVPAFRLFMEYAVAAFGVRFMKALETALRREDMWKNPPVLNEQGRKVWPIQTNEQKEEMKAAAMRIIRARHEPLLPAIRRYVEQRRTDPVTIQRVTWLVDQIATIPGALDGKYLATSEEQPAGFLLKLPYAPTIWREFHDELLTLLDETAAINAAPSPTEDTTAPGAPATRIEWKGSVQVLAWLLRELAEKGWIEAPRHRSTTTRYSAGDIIAKRYAEVMAPHFGVNLTTLERELKPEGASVPAQDVEEFRIPVRPE